jgi:hypothetical protein
VNVQNSGVEIDRAPRQAEHLTAPYSGVGEQAEHDLPPFPADLLQQTGQFGGRRSRDLSCWSRAGWDLVIVRGNGGDEASALRASSRRGGV